MVIFQKSVVELSTPTFLVFFLVIGWQTIFNITSTLIKYTGNIFPVQCNIHVQQVYEK